MRASVHLVSLVAALLGVQALAQTAAPAAAQPTTDASDKGVDEVVVRGRRMSDVRDELRKYVNEFVLEVAKPPPGRGFARWQRKVCVSVTNLQADAAQYLVNRISQTAADVGLTPGEPGCRPQVIVIFAADGKTMAGLMVEQEPLMFWPWGHSSGTTFNRGALDDFKMSERAVRWWPVSMPVDANTGTTAIRIPGQPPPTISVSGPSRIHGGIVDDLLYVLIIVDSHKLTGTTWQQLGDYLSVVALAQVDPAADAAAFDSILNVFNNPTAYSGLTDWDRSYLKALYSFDQERTPRMQVNELVGTMVKQELAPPEAED